MTTTSNSIVDSSPLHSYMLMYNSLLHIISNISFSFVHNIIAITTSRRYYNPIILTLSTVVIFGSFIFSIAIPNAFHFLQHMALGQYQYYHTSYSSSANNDGSDDYDSIGDHFLFLSLAWLFSCVVTAAVIVYRDCRGGGGAERSYYYGAQTDDVGINNCDDGTLKPIVDTTPRPFYSAPPLLANTNAYNMFDPADLPPRLNEYANMVYSVCNNLGYFFGFQDSSVRNQAEHLLILISNNRRNMNSHIILPPALQPSSPIRALHDKVFSNYMKWCHYLGVRPHFAGIASVVPSVRKTGMAEQQEQPISSSDTTLVVDLVLFFCIWGEAGNIRHMPECVWFLYHKMMEEYSNSMLQDPPPLSPRSLYAGHFLDYVVTPIYNIVSTVSSRPCFCYVVSWNSDTLCFVLTLSQIILSSLWPHFLCRVCNLMQIISTNETTTTSTNSSGPLIVFYVTTPAMIRVNFVSMSKIPMTA